MSDSARPSRRRATLRRAAQRVGVAVGLSLALAVLLSPVWTPSPVPLVRRTLALGMVALLIFVLFERWPRRLPKWLARWVLQVVGVGVAMPVTTSLMYILTPPGAPAFWGVEERRLGFMMLTFLSILVAPWTALAALILEKEAFARRQATEFALERSELERQALDARLRLLQAQVAPHFLFNTLANIQALVDTGSPQASAVLRSLTAYLRAAVPLLEESATTLGRELQLVEAYLELMRMRMPDRLRYTVRVDAAARALRCPPCTLLTLVENAVRHGIDPSEEGGEIEIAAERRDGRVVVRVTDSGVGLRTAAGEESTGLSTLRERLRVLYGDSAQVRLIERSPRGVCAELELPARGEAA